NAGHRWVENRPIFQPKIKSANFRIVSGLFVRPFFGILAVFFLIGKVGKKSADFADRPIFAAIMGKSADFLPIKNLRMSSDLQEEDKKKKRKRRGRRRG
ncbi:unnamed protein product, partial [Staurois parvus]